MNLLFCFFLIITSVFVNLGRSCRHPFSSFKSVLYVRSSYGSSSRHLESVVEINHFENQRSNCEQWLSLDSSEFEEIRNDTFKNLPVYGLEITGENSIIFNEGSLTGLPKLQCLNMFITPVLPITNTNKWTNIYGSVKNIIHLTYPFVVDDDIKDVLPIFSQLKSLVMTESPYALHSNAFQGASNTITDLKISTDNPIRIHHQAYSGLSGLTDLTFINTKINFLDFDGPFDGLKNLKNLDIWFDPSSKAGNITKNTFKGLNKLENLTIRKDDVIDHYSLDSFIEADSFNGLKLKKLDLSNFYIGRFRMGIFKGLSVENLYVKPVYDGHVQELAFYGIKITNLYLIGTNFKLNDYFKVYYALPETTNIYFQ